MRGRRIRHLVGEPDRATFSGWVFFRSHEEVCEYQPGEGHQDGDHTQTEQLFHVDHHRQPLCQPSWRRAVRKIEELRLQVAVRESGGVPARHVRPDRLVILALAEVVGVPDRDLAAGKARELKPPGELL